MRNTCTWPLPQSGVSLSSALIAVSRNAHRAVKRELVSRLSLTRAIRTLNEGRFGNVRYFFAFHTKAGCPIQARSHRAWVGNQRTQRLATPRPGAPSWRSLIAPEWERNEPQRSLLLRLPHKGRVPHPSAVSSRLGGKATNPEVCYSSAFHTYAPGCANPICASTRYANCRAISVESTGLL